MLGVPWRRIVRELDFERSPAAAYHHPENIQSLRHKAFAALPADPPPVVPHALQRLPDERSIAFVRTVPVGSLVPNFGVAPGVFDGGFDGGRVQEHIGQRSEVSRIAGCAPMK